MQSLHLGPPSIYILTISNLSLFRRFHCLFLRDSRTSEPEEGGRRSHLRSVSLTVSISVIEINVLLPISHAETFNVSLNPAFTGDQHCLHPHIQSSMVRYAA
jgi:hypothetical protein